VSFPFQSVHDYLPTGHRSKDLDKLIRLVAQANFWEQLPQSGKAELESIIQCLLPNFELLAASASPGGGIVTAVAPSPEPSAN
jgi:hypothetical protein